MKTLTLDNGTVLNQGDFLIISYSNSLTYGWFCGQGRGGNTLHFYSINSPSHALEAFKDWEKGDKEHWLANRFEKEGFTSKAFYKTYLNTYPSYRLLKVDNPDSLFTADKEKQEKYEKSKEALIKVKFLNK